MPLPGCNVPVAGGALTGGHRDPFELLLLEDDWTAGPRIGGSDQSEESVVGSVGQPAVTAADMSSNKDSAVSDAWRIVFTSQF